MGTMGQVAAGLAAVQSRIDAACAKAGRDPREVRLMAVSKTHPASVLREAYEAGCRIFDAASGGIGGCPFAPGATGNIATEDLVYMLERAGFSTGYDIDALIETARWIGERIGRPAPSALSRAGRFPRA